MEEKDFITTESECILCKADADLQISKHHPNILFVRCSKCRTYGITRKLQQTLSEEIKQQLGQGMQDLNWDGDKNETIFADAESAPNINHPFLVTTPEEFLGT